MATRTFSYFDEDGCAQTAVAGRTRVIADHEVVRRFPGGWRVAEAMPSDGRAVIR